MRRLVIGLGSNLGDRAATLAAACDQVARADGLALVARSSLWETSPVGGPPQPDYLNAAALLVGSLAPRVVLERLLAVEAALGRVRSVRDAPRTIDLDLLWIDGEVVSEPDLLVPHPRLGERAFALAPLLEVAPDARDPRTGEPLAACLAALGLAGVRRVGPFV